MAEIKDMKAFHIFSAAYTGSAVKRGEFGGKKEIAFIGRSNVGKSSLINSVTGARKLAHVSREPGKTRTINYYSIQSRRDTGNGEERQEWYLVDLPGYGFAKTSQENRDSWGRFIDDYIRNSPHLVMVGLLVDLRHPGLPIDIKAYEWLRKTAPGLQIIGTKCDKLGKNELNKNLNLLNRCMPSEKKALAYSSLTGYGKEELLSRIEEDICREEPV